METARRAEGDDPGQQLFAVTGISGDPLLCRQPDLLDTNIVSDLVRNPQGNAAKCLAAIGDGDVCTSIVVAAELRFCAVKRASSRLTGQLEAVLAALVILPLEPPADLHYGVLRTALEATGQRIGANDMLITAHCLALDCVLVTDNNREFAKVPGLQVENWLR